jgi:gelsolin
MEVSVNSLNSGDVFILDHNYVIFQWFGKNASQMKRGKALNITTRMRDERMNRVKAEVILQNQGKETDQFWEILGGQGEIAPANSTYTDEQWDQLEFDEYKIYSLILSTDEKSLEVSVVETSGQILSTSMINPDLSYIIDDQFELFLWYGKGSLIPVIARTLAMNEAKRIISDSGRPEWTKVTTVEQGLEPILLKSRFMGFWSWSKRDSEQSLPSLEKLPVSPISPRKTKDKKDNYVNVDALHFPEKYAAAREDTMEKKFPVQILKMQLGKN